MYEVNLSTCASRKLIENGQCYTCVFNHESIVVSRSREIIVFIAEDAAHEPELWATDTEFKSLRQLTRLNPQFDSRPMGTAQVIDWLSDDGERLQGACSALQAIGPEDGIHWSSISTVAFRCLITLTGSVSQDQAPSICNFWRREDTPFCYPMRRSMWVHRCWIWPRRSCQA